MATRKPKDRHLDVPSEANRDKHINFIALENDEPDPADMEEEKPLEEKIEDKKRNRNKRNKTERE
jgi:hypothetical protein